MKKRIRFSDLENDQVFSWAGREMKKLTDQRALAQSPRQEFIFKSSDLVTVDIVDSQDDYGDLFSTSGLTGQGDPNDPYYAQPWTGTKQDCITTI